MSSKPHWYTDWVLAQLWIQLCAFVTPLMDRKLRRREGPEDIVQTAFRTFVRRGDIKAYPVQTPAELGRLLCTIAYNKLIKHAKYHRSKKRSPEREEYDKDDGLQNRGARHEDLVTTENLIAKATEGLNGPEYEIVLWLIQGYSQRGFSAARGHRKCAVNRWVQTIRNRLEKLGKTKCGQPSSCEATEAVRLLEDKPELRRLLWDMCGLSHGLA